MVISQSPGASEVALNMTDFIIDTDATINFSVQHKGSVILNEKYSPDGAWQVRTHKLGKFLAQALWGNFPSGNVYEQPYVKGDFDFYIDDVLQCTSNVLYSARFRPSASQPVFLSPCLQKITRPGVAEYLTINSAGSAVTVSAANPSGEVVNASLGSVSSVTTFNVGVSRVSAVLGFEPIGSYTVWAGGNPFVFYIDHNQYVEVHQFRYKNVFDCPEVVSCTGVLSLKGKEKASTGYMFGVERKFDVNANDEYTCESGVIFLGSEYKFWHDFLNTREAQILIDGVWYPIIISKQNYEREFRKNQLKSVEFSFRFADPDQNGLL